MDVFEGTDACVAPVLDFDEAVAHPVNTERDVFYQDNGHWQASPAPRFSRSRPDRAASPNGAGTDAESILAALGYGSDDIVALRASGAVL